MPSVTSFTKARMDQMAGESIASSYISGQYLILVREDGTEINAGDVKGLQGDPGTPGPVSQATVDAALTPYAPGQWINLSLVPQWVGANTYVGADNPPPSYRLHKNRIFLSGDIFWIGADVSTSPSVLSITNTPLIAGHRPQSIMFLGGVWGLDYQADIRAQPDGSLQFVFWSGSALPSVITYGDRVVLSGLSFPID